MKLLGIATVLVSSAVVIGGFAQVFCDILRAYHDSRGKRTWNDTEHHMLITSGVLKREK